MKTPIFNISPGKTISYHGRDCIVLEHRQDDTLLIAAEQIEHEFGETNNFAASSLRSYLNGPYLDSLTQGHPDEIITRTVDLTALNGSKEYGTCECKVAPLTLSEIGKYYDILPEPEYWNVSVTPWLTPSVNNDDRWILGLFFNFDIKCDLSSNITGCRPAFLITSDYPVEDDSNPLERFTTKELMRNYSDTHANERRTTIGNKYGFTFTVEQTNPFYDPYKGYDGGGYDQPRYTIDFKDGTRVEVLDFDLGAFGGHVSVMVTYPDAAKEYATTTDYGWNSDITERAAPYFHALGIPCRLKSEYARCQYYLYPKKGILHRMRQLASMAMDQRRLLESELRR